MNFDFSALLLILTVVSGAIWAVDTWLLAPKRQGIPSQVIGESTAAGLPLIVEYARSFFPIFLFVLVLRSFIVEPFRIPSASMMPTLLIGDFILVNKYDYGIRLPVLNTLVYRNKTPERGDIIVFRYPEDPSIPYIKRVVGLPGDHITYYDKTLFINGKPVEQEDLGKYVAMGSGEMMDGASLRLENLESVTHEILVDLERYSRDVEGIVPENHYFVLGDNRDRKSVGV